MNRMQKAIRTVLWSLILVVGLYIVYRGLVIAGETGLMGKVPLLSGMREKLETVVVDAYMPGVSYREEETSREESWLTYIVSSITPLYGFTEGAGEGVAAIESKQEREMLLETEPAGEKETETESQTEGETEEKETESDSQTETEAAEAVAREPVQEIQLDQLQDYNILLNNYFAVDPSTAPDSELINLDSFMSKDLKMQAGNDLPQILIYHTHSQEAYVDSVEGDVSMSVVGVGEHLTELLQGYGYNVIHHTGVYDMVDGELDRNKAYNFAAEAVSQILADNPSIEVVIDLHRDGVDGKKFVTEIDGKPTAQIMFFNGLSRTARNGEIDYLYNPYITDNLALSFQLQLKAAQYYPGYTRPIYLQSLRYNLHMKPKSLLIEAGTQLNTVEEIMNAMEPLADILDQVLRGE